MSFRPPGDPVALDNALTDIIQSDPDCLAAGWVDMATGALLRVMTGNQPEDGVDLVAAATTDVFKRVDVVGIEQLFKSAHGVSPSDHYFREIIVKSRDLIHMFARGQHQDDPVLVVVMRVSADLAVVIRSARGALTAVADG